MTKRCTRCELVKPASEFYAHRTNSDGLMGACKICHRADAKRRRTGNPAVRAYEHKRSQLPHRKAASKLMVARFRLRKKMESANGKP